MQYKRTLTVCAPFLDKLKVDIKKYDIHMEPSAGTGSFYNLMDISKRIGIDIDSKCEGVINMDFLSHRYPTILRNLYFCSYLVCS